MFKAFKEHHVGMIVSMCLNGPSAQKSNIFLHLGGFYLGPFYCHHSMARTCLLYISNWIILFKTFKAHHGGMIVSEIVLFKNFQSASCCYDSEQVSEWTLCSPRTTTQTSPPHQRPDLLFSFLLLQFTLVNICHL